MPPVSAWEIGLLAVKGRIDLDLDPREWFTRFPALPGVRLPLTPDAAILLSSFLPGAFHGAPADRLLVATALSLPAMLVTRDEWLLAYAGPDMSGRPPADTEAARNVPVRPFGPVALAQASK